MTIGAQAVADQADLPTLQGMDLARQERIASSSRTRGPWIGLAAAVGMAALGMLVPAVTGWDVHVRSFPPLHAAWDPRIGPGTVPACGIALLAALVAPRLAESLAWGRLLLVAWTGGVAWLLSLAFVDGADGIGTILGTDYEYLQTARQTRDLPHTLSIYIDKIPFDAPTGNWPVHIAGHPPGALTFFVLLDRIGLGGGFAAGLVVTLIAATTALAVLVTMRALGAEQMGRRALPVLVFGPAAIWQAVSADAMFAAVAAWGIATLACAATACGIGRRLGFSLVSGLLLGYAVMLSYGLPLIGVLAIAILVVARSWRPLIPAVLAAVSVVALYAAFGFEWWRAIGVLRQRYWDGVASARPAGYWIWGDLSALVFSAGPLVGAGVGAALSLVIGRRRSLEIDDRTRAVLWISGAAAAMILAADASQMSKAEVERIWLPFVPWLLLATALLPQRWRSRGLVLQLVVALVVQHLLATGW